VAACGAAQSPLKWRPVERRGRAPVAGGFQSAGEMKKIYRMQWIG
jgi:hypothetical protein